MTSNRLIQAPLVSVLMPARNAADYIGDAIRSVLEQSLTDFELLIFDDGSSDDTTAIAREFEAIDRRVRCFRRPHRGRVATLNELIGCARAPFLARANADDVSLPDRLTEQVRFLRRSPWCAAVGAALVLIDGSGTELGVASPPLEHESIDGAALGGRSALHHPASTFRADAIFDAGGYRRYAHPAEDLDLSLRLGETRKLANLPDPFIATRQHGASVAAKAGDELIAAARKLCIDMAADRRGLDRIEPTFSQHAAVDPTAMRAASSSSSEPHLRSRRSRPATHRIAG